MALTIGQILAPVTTKQARATIVAILVSSGIPADRWVPTGVASSMLTAIATVFSMTVTQISLIIAYFFLPISTGFGLQLLAQYVYGVTVPLATFAAGPYAAVNAGGGSYSILAGQFSVQNVRTGMTYTNVSNITILPLTTTTFQIQATQSGSIGNANPGDVTAILTPLLGVTGSNPNSLLGLDAPSDAVIRALCIASLGARSVRGPRSAYAFAIMTATNPVTLNPVNINRWTITPASHTGTVGIVVAGPAGVTDPNDVLGVISNIEAVARPDAVTVTVAAATTTPYAPSIQFTVIAPAAVAATDIQAAAQAAADLFLETYPIGGQLIQDDAHPGGFQGLAASGVYGAIAQGVSTIAGCVFVSARGGLDLSLTTGVVATDNLVLGVPTVIPSQV